MNLEEKIRKATDSFFEENRGDDAPSSSTSDGGKDFYDDLRRDVEKEERRRYSSGARPKLSLETKAIVKGLAADFCSAKRRYESSLRRGDMRIADIIASQYMHDVFLPAVEAMVRLNSADEMLGSPDMLKKLDEYVIVRGNSIGDGFTRAFIKSLYSDELGRGPVMSDSTVRDGIRDIELLLARGAVRTAVGRAEKLLKKIDAGQQIAIDDDYLILNKVVSRS